MVTNERLQRFVEFNFSKTCKTEEDVKLKYIVPFFEALGHDRMYFEVEKADILIKYGKTTPDIIIEAKNCSKDLKRYVAQLKKYWRKHKSLIAVLCNGRELWIYHPTWTGRIFKDTLLFTIKYSELIQKKDILINLLSYDSFTSGEVRKHLCNYELQIINRAEMLDYVNYYGLIEGKQIMFCTSRKKSTNMVLMCKTKKAPDKYKLSPEGENYLKSLPCFDGSNYIAYVEIIPLKKNCIEMWKNLYKTKLFPYWDPVGGPNRFNQPLKSIAICRVYAIDAAIDYGDISGKYTCRKLAKRKKIQKIREVLSSRKPVMNDNTYKEKRDRIHRIIKGYI